MIVLDGACCTQCSFHRDWSVAFGRSIDMGYVRPDHAAPGTRLKVRMQGRLWDAEVTVESPHDPGNTRLRADFGVRNLEPVV